MFEKLLSKHSLKYKLVGALILLTVAASTISNISAFNSFFNIKEPKAQANTNQFDFPYSGRTELFIVPETGVYTLETWGAQGGERNSSYPGGKGGYSSGEVTLTQGDEVYITVGGFGDHITKGFNGGGKSSHTGNATYGGGASDIRLGGQGLYNRVIVAAGGGASSVRSLGGYAGGVVGGNGAGGATYMGQGATQSLAPGRRVGGYGFGGAGYSYSTSSTYNNGGGGGGGGWYGGGGGYEDSNYATTGGGGSSYVYTATSYKPTGYNPDKKYFMSKAAVLSGRESFFNPSGQRATGNVGNGYVRISLSDEAQQSTAQLQEIRIDGVLLDGFQPGKYEYSVEVGETEQYNKEITVVKNHTDQKVDGTGKVEVLSGSRSHIIRVYSVDGIQSNDYVINFERVPTTKLLSLDFNGYNYKKEEQFSHDKYEYNLDVFQYTEIIPTYTTFDSNATVVFEGLDNLKKGMNTVKVTVKRTGVSDTVYTINVNVEYSIDFNFENREQKFVVPHTGQYKLDVWGAQGGSRITSYPGGKGGFSSGVVSLVKGEIIYVNVGGEGNHLSKGFNGGGKSSHTGNETYGGGATDVRVAGNGLFNRIIVAGGGGASSVRGYGGLAGGETGRNGVGGANYMGQGATQTTAPGRRVGGFGFGGAGYAYSTSSTYNNGGGGGGGGWYGGGGGYEDSNYATSGGGGSGYLFTNKSHKPSGYGPDSKYYLTHISDGSIGDKALNTWEQSFIDVDGKRVDGHVGDGFARITYFSDGFKSSPNLQNIYIDGEQVSNFNPDQEEYTVTLPGDYVGTKEIVVQKSLETQVVVGNGYVDLLTGDYSHDIFVLSSDKTKNKTYKINFIREKTSYLKSLEIEGFLFKDEVEFEPSVLNYEVDVFLDDKITVNYSVFNEDNIVSILGLDNLKVGRNTVTVVSSNVSGETTTYTIIVNRKTSIDYEFEKRLQTFVVPYDGKYKLDVWGAQGGSRIPTLPGGGGGFSSGVLDLKKGEVLYLYVGGAGTADAAGYNGGGKSSHTGVETYGGGASDVRIGGTGYFNRVIVAGGGGASSMRGLGGLAGGLQGGNGVGGANYMGQGASQTTAPGRRVGGFGFGGAGYAYSTSSTYNNGGGGGGGGWYGGGGGYEDSNYATSGGGGSGYILTDKSVKPTGYNPDKKYYFDKINDGSIGDKDLNTWKQSFIDVDGKRVSGHEGSGHIRITYYSESVNKSTDVNYIEINGNKIQNFNPNIREYTIEIDAEYVDKQEFVIDKRHTDQEIIGDTSIELTHHNKTQTFTIISADKTREDTYVVNFVRKPSTKLYDLSIDEYTYSFTENFRYDKYSYDLSSYVYGGVKVHYKTFDQDAKVVVKGLNDSDLRPGNNKITVTVSRSGVADTVYEMNAYRQRDIEFKYTGATEKFKIPYTGVYKLELWGAQGGERDPSLPGGKGGYVTGEIYLRKDELLYVNVGGEGNATSKGFNGGGKSSHTGTETYGGGASDIRFGGEGLYNRVLVAGGGGASSARNSGGSGGGLSGTNGAGGSNYMGQGASQSTAPGRRVGGFGVGGAGYAYSTSSTYNNGGGGGGGGWYGGGGGYEDSNYATTGGGGSGYAFSLTSYKPDNYAPSIKYYSSNVELIDGDNLMPGKDGHTVTGNEGDGFIRIALQNMYGTEARLKYIEFDNGTLNTEFDSDLYEYDLVLDPDETQLVISADTIDHNASVDWDSTEELTIQPGISTFNLVTTAQDGTTAIYVVRVHRTASTTSHLTDLTIDGTTVEGFEEGKFDYTINLAYDQDRKATIGWTNKRPAQTITGEKEIVFENNVSQVILVVSEDGNSESEYTITPIIEDSNLLKELTVEEVAIDFEPEIFEYDVEVPLGVSSLKVTAIPYDHEATVDIVGNGYLRVGMNVVTITVKEPFLPDQIYTINVLRSETTDGSVDTEYDYVYKGEVQYFQAPYTGNYKLETWGAEGGNRGNSKGGQGGYSTGIVRLKQGEIVAVYVGGQGGKEQQGYNGGAISGTANVYGGGASDVRVGEHTLYDRIIVAGGGGSVGAANKPGAAGGGLVGISNTNSYGSGGNGGTQTAPGIRGEFGIGGNGLFQNGGRSGAGGGGWYGGGGSTPDYATDDDRGGGGGSSYLFTEDSHKPEGYNVKDEYYLKDANTIAGNAQLPGKDGGYTTGNSGNGFVRITALRRASTDNYLKDIELNKGATLTPEFDVETKEYDVHLDVHHTELVIKGITMDPLSVVSGNGSYFIPSEGLEVELVVTAEDGSIRIYKLNITREISNNSLPQNIEITGLIPSLCDLADEYCVVTPEFNVENTFETGGGVYSLIVPGRIRSVEFSVIKGHHFQEVIGGGVIELEPGADNTVFIEVASEDGTSYSSYMFNIDRDMTGNADLEKLEIISPERDLEFETDITEYYVSVPNEIEHTDDIVFDMKAMDNNANIFIEGEGDLNLGNNRYVINVVANNGLTKQYIINIYREDNSNTFLKRMIVTHNEQALLISPSFNKTLHQYSLTVENEIESIILIAEAEELTSDVGMNENGIYELEVGQNEINIPVTAEDGSSSVYTINILRKESSNTRISNIKINGNIVDAFNTDLLNQTIEIDSQIIRPKIEVELENEFASFVISGKYTSFEKGTNMVYVRVTAENGKVDTYSINFNKGISDDSTLESVEANIFDLKDRFTKEDTLYEINIPYTEEQLEIEGIPSHITSKVNGNGKYNLVSGDNEVKIEVTAEDNTSTVYTFKINMLRNTNPELKEINLDHGIFDPDFNSKVTDYSINVPNEVDVLNVEGIATISSTEIVGNGEYILKTGLNVIKINTKSESGAKMVYTLNVLRDVSSNADLSYLLVHEGALHRTFLPGVIEYDIKVPFGTRRLNIEASVADPFATYTILNSTGLREGLNVVTIRVTPQDGVGVKDYRLNVFVQGPASENIDLTDLKVSEGVMKPDFLPIRQFYRVQVENDIKSIHIKGTARQNVVITGNGDHELKVGLNVIVIRTRALNGVTKDYQVEINRKPSSDAQLRSLEVTGTINSIGFRPDTYVYNNAQTFRTSLGLKPTTRHAEARVEIIGNANFVTGGKDVVIVRVTAEDGITIQDYTLNIRKLPSNDDTLKLLSLSGVHIEPEFRSGRRTYTASVTEDIRQINISAEATDPNAKLEYSVVHNLDVGKNFIDVEVIAETGKRGKYTVEITRQGSLIRDLAGISIDGEPLANFDKDKLFYELDYDFEKESIIVDVDKVDDKSSVAGDGVVALKVGTHDYPISVTSEHGEIKVYTLSVTRRAINSSELETLNVNQYPFDQPFDGAKKTYNITIDNEFDRLQLDIRTKDPKATFVVNGNSNLKIGNNKIEIVVTSSGKDKTDTYVINAYKQEYGNNFLAYLAVNRDKLKPAFHQGTMVYEVDVSYEFDTIEITGETVEASAQVSNLGVHPLEYGVNQIKIPVRAHNGVVRTYHVFVNRSRSHDNYLNTLQIQVGGTNQTYTPKFDPKVNEYTLDEQLSPDVDFVNIITTSNATNIVGNGQQVITVGKNKLEIKVTSDSGRENIYYINLDRVASTNANLINIIPTSGKLSPNFLYTEDTYTIYVDTATTTLAFETITENKNATVTGNDRQIVPVGDSQRIITVTSENGQEKEYTINLKKNDTNNALMKSLSMHDLVAKKEIPISPEFDTEVFTYNVTVPNSKTVVRANEFQFTTWDSNATVETSGTMSLLTGEYPNVYEFRVTAVDGFTSETYRINITRESSNIATVDEIEFSNGVLDKRFNPHVFEYDLEFEQNAEMFNRTSITKLIRTEGKSTITYSHDEDIVLKEGTVVPFIITVTSENGKVVNNYTFNVSYKRSRDNKLSSIEIANAIFEPEFNPEILEYDINVHEDITEVVVRAFARDPKAKVLSVLGDTELINYTTTIEIKVEAENGSIATYKLNIKRGLSHDLTIEDLRLTDAQGAKFNPEFDNFLSSYEATVNREVDHVGIVVIKGHDSQIVSLYDRFNNPLDMKNFELNMGRNLFKLKIASPFGDEKFIDILIVRDGNSNNYLEALEVLDPQIDINFDQDKHEYFIEIPYNFDNLRLNAVAQESSSTVEILRNDGFTVGNNDVIIRVTAENGDVRNYVIHVFKKGLYNNVLQTITVSVDGKVISEDPSFFTPHFHKGTLDYTVKVNSNVKVLTVEGVPEENSTTVSGSAANVVSTTPRGVQIELNPGNNLVKLTSTDAVDGQVLIYRVNIVREMSGDADLNGLQVFNKDTFVPFNEGEFSSARNFYSLEVDSSVTELRVIASATNPQSRVTITGNTSLLNGENLIKVTVTSEDRTRVKVYSIIVTKTLPTNTDIDSLNITHDEATHIHEFDMESELFEYSVPHDVESVMVGGSTSDPLADINGLGRHALDYGVNELKITVRAQSGLVKTYVINVTRAYNNELESLKINQGLLEPEFEQGVYYYTVWVPLVVDRMNFEAIPEAATSTVTGDGWHNLEIGSDNFIKITVSSPDGSYQETIIKVIRSASPNNQIAILEIDQGLISPEFDSNLYLYDTYIKDFNTEIDLTVILEDEAATYEVVQPQNAVITGDRVNIKGVVDDLTEVIIRVTAENGDTKDTVLNVHRQPAALFSNLLSSLTVSPVKSMSPTFRPTTNQYIALVDEDINFITITATKQSVDATIVKGTGTFKVEPGRNTYEIVVRSKDGIDNVYRVIINQAVSADASLKSLSFDEGLLTPVFSRGRKEYRMNVSANTNFLTANVEPYANGTTWKPTGGGFTEDLVMGENTIVIDTLATNKIGTDKYTVAVNKTTQTSVYLSELRSNTGNFTEAFNKYSEGPYTLEIDANVNSLMLSAKAEEPASVLSIEGVGIIDLMGVNNKTVEILVTGNAGNTMKYYVNIVKKLKDDVKLSYLAVSPGTLTPQFNENISKYEVNVDSSVDRIEIFANTTGPATIEGTGIKDLKPGVNTFDVTLTTDLGSIGVYTIVVNREVERSAKIFDLSFKEVLIEAPLFEKDTFEYQLYVPYEVTELTIRDIILEDEENSTYELVQTSFAVGNNVVVINVKNTLTNDEETYTFNVTRYAFSSNFLTNLYTDQGLLSPSFDKLHNNYDINIPYDVTQIELIGQKEDGTSSEVGLGVHRDLEVGINELKVVVTSATGVPRTYIVRVNRLQDSRNELLTLDVVGGVMSPKFGDSEFNEYTVNVNADVNEIEFIGTIPDTATVEGLGKLTITKAEMKHEIIVTAQDGSTTKYKFTIKKQLSTDSGVINIKPSVSVLDPAFEQDVHTYTVTVEDETNRLGFEVTTSNKFARVTGHEEKQLSYGDNLFVIEVKSEDGSTSVEYVINVIRLKDIHGLQIDPDNYVLNLNEEKELDLIITPIDAPNSGITWESDNEAAVTVDENGKITGVGIGTANIIATYTKNPAIKATVSVEVMSLSIESDILDIERDILTESDIPGYVIGSDLVTTDEFTDLFINEKSTLKVFDMDGNEINEPSDLISTKYVLKLIVNDVVYDELVIIVRGDVNSDAAINLNDSKLVEDYVRYIEELDEIALIAANVERDDSVNLNDSKKIIDFVRYIIDSLND